LKGFHLPFDGVTSRHRSIVHWGFAYTTWRRRHIINFAVSCITATDSISVFILNYFLILHFINGLSQCSRCRRCTLRHSKLHRCARHWKRVGTSSDSGDSYGRFRWTLRRLRPSTSTSPSFELAASSASTPETTGTYTISSRVTSSARHRMPSYKPCGSNPITRKRRSCADVPSAPSTSTGSARSSLCPEPSGTVSRRRTASRSEPATCCVSGTYRTRTRTPPRSGSWPRPRGSHRHKSETGSRTDVSETGPPPLKTGQFIYPVSFVLIKIFSKS